MFLPKKVLKSKIFNAKKSFSHPRHFEIRSTPWGGLSHYTPTATTTTLTTSIQWPFDSIPKVTI